MINDNPLISIIVPFYNAEKTINQTIESILCQTYHNYELILINDGSTDSSLHICKEYAKIDNRIIIINQNNQGLEKTRLNSLKILNGQYLVFIDADDWIISSYLEILLKYSIEYNADITQINSYKTIDKYGIIKIKLHEFEKRIYTSKQLIEYKKNYLERLIPNNVWGKLYKTSLFSNIEITPWNIHWGEDLHLNLMISPFISTILFIDVFGYYYRYGGSTATYDSRFWPDHCTLYYKRKEYFKTYDPQYIQTLKWQLTEQYVANIDLMIRFTNQNKSSIIDYIKSTFNTEIYNELLPKSHSNKRLSEAIHNKDAFLIYKTIKSQTNYLSTLKTKFACILSKLFI